MIQHDTWFTEFVKGHENDPEYLKEKIILYKEECDLLNDWVEGYRTTIDSANKEIERLTEQLRLCTIDNANILAENDRILTENAHQGHDLFYAAKENRRLKEALERIARFANEKLNFSDKIAQIAKEALLPIPCEDTDKPR